MHRKIRTACTVAYSAFASEPSTLLAQSLIALLLLTLGVAATTRVEAGLQPATAYGQMTEGPVR